MWETLRYFRGLGQEMLRHVSGGGGEFGWETQAVTVDVSGEVCRRFSLEETVRGGDRTQPNPVRLSSGVEIFGRKH